MSEGIDLEAAWSAVEADWDDPARHVAFVAQARIAGKLGVAAARYRAVSMQDEAYRSLATRAEDAKKRLGAITALALIELQSTATLPEDNQKIMRWLKAVAVLALVVSSLMLYRGCTT